MQSKRGFTLIEWMIYFFLISTVLTGIFHFVATVHQRISKLKRETHLFAHLCSLQDALAHDIMRAPANLNCWDELGPSCLAWRKDNNKIIWKQKGNTLVREAHHFDAKSKKWISQRKSVVAHTIKKVKFVVAYWNPRIEGRELGKRIQRVSCSLVCSIGNQDRCVERVVMLQNRVVL